MGDERYTQSNAPYGSAPDYGQPYEGCAPAEDHRGYGDGRAAGFNRHQSSNARRVAAQNPLKDGARRIGSAVSGLTRSAVAKLPSSAPVSRPARSVPHDDDDYLGDGEPCRLCGNPVDPSQSRCPHCGAFARPLYRSAPFWLAVVGAVVAVVLLSVLITSCRSGSVEAPPVEPPDASDPAPAATLTDKSALTAAVASAQGMLDAQATSHPYTVATARNLQAAVDEANAVLQNDVATDEEVSAAAQGVSDAMAGLVNLLESGTYPWPAHADLPSCLGQQVAVNGTTQDLSTDETGLSTALLAMGGNPDTSVYVQYYAGAADGDIYAGRDFTATGTVIGDLNGLPLVLADWIEVL